MNTVASDRGPFALVGDVGGTNCRLAVARLGGDRPEILAPLTLKCADYPGIGAAISAYLERGGGRAAVDRSVIAVAGPVADGAVVMTNHPWIITEGHISGLLGGAPARLINDYAALAYAAPALAGEDLRPLASAGPARAHETIAVLGAGTGFGVSALVRDAGREAALVGEGGHVAFAPQDVVEIELQRLLASRFGRVSIERILSGQGLVNLHEALSEIEGLQPAYAAPDALTAAAARGEARAVAATERFCAILGSVAGDFALSYGARGGVQIAGGVSQLLLATPAAAAFRPRFEDKGRFRSYVAAIPTAVVQHPHAALLGAARLAASSR